jgi:hypothetical protein
MGIVDVAGQTCIREKPGNRKASKRTGSRRQTNDPIQPLSAVFVNWRRPWVVVQFEI